MKIGFVGQGWIGKNYADDFERRGFDVVRYAKEDPYSANSSLINKCDIVFLAVPTPTTSEGFDDSILRSVMGLVGKGKIAVIKSTMLPGTTISIQEENPEVFVLHSPEFLSESTAAHDAANPKRNIVGIPFDMDEYREKAQVVLSMLPKAPYEKICGSTEAEIIKYGRNTLGFARVVFANLLYDLTQSIGADWETVREALIADPDNGPTYMNPIHKKGRGAGGNCFIKDFKAFTDFYFKSLPQDDTAVKLLEAMQRKNNELLLSTKKDIDLLIDVYGKEITYTHAENK